MLRFEKNNVHKILIIKPQAIGDVLLSTPVIENLRHNFPEAHISFLVRSYCADVLKGNPFLDRILSFNINPASGDSSLCLIKNIHMQKYDLIIDLFGNPRTAIIVFNSDAKYRVGYRFKWRALAYNIKVKSRGGEVHNIEFNLDSLRALGLEIVTVKPALYLNAIHKEYAEDFFMRNGLNDSKVIGINPSGTWPTKVWPEAKFAELGRKLSSANNKILLFWGYGEEKSLAERIRNNIGENSILIPETDISYMGALAKKCRLFITNDTGPMHIAWVLGVNVAAIFGPTNPALQGPLNNNSLIIRNEELSCLGCNLTQINQCPFDHKCMENLSVEYVFERIMSCGYLD